MDIISVDSSLVYRQMDIGTAKPDASVLARAPHRLIDIRDPAQAYSAAAFVTDARQHIIDITAAGRIPLLVGGTMLYFRALLRGLADLPPADAEIRRQIAEEADIHGWPHLHEVLASADPETAARLHPNHSQRIARALEVLRITGVPMSAWLARQQAERGGDTLLSARYRVLQLALLPQDRSALHQLIEARFMAMLSAGLVDEVNALMARQDLHADLPAMRAVGYRQVWAYLAGQYGYREMINRSVAATRQLAKRQLTWLRSWPDILPIEIDNRPVSNAGISRANEAESTRKVLSNALNYLEKSTIYFD